MHSSDTLVTDSLPPCLPEPCTAERPPLGHRCDRQYRSGRALEGSVAEWLARSGYMR